jgi:chromosome segregation ATPase
MLKKFGIGGGIVAALFLLLVVLFGADATSILKTGAKQARDMVKNSVSVEFELERARDMIADLDPEIRNAMHTIAKQEVAVDQMREQRDGLKETLAQNLKDIDRLRTDLERGDSTYVYAGKSYNESAVKADLTHRWDRYKTKLGTLDKLDAILEARMRSLDAANTKLTEMRAPKAQLEVEVENLSAQLELVKAAQAGSDLTLDDSLLSRTKDLVKDIETRIAVDQKILDAEDSYAGQIKLDAPETRDILDEIAQELDKSNEEYIVLDD